MRPDHDQERTKLPTLPGIAALAAGGLATSSLALAARRAMASRPSRILDIRDLGDRVLIVAPHPDDEVLATGGTIHRLIGAGARVRVVIVTAGDGYRRAAARQRGVTGSAAYLALGETRHRESVAALAALGCPSSDVVSLGYPDGATLAMWDRCWDEADSAGGRNGAARIPYDWAANPDAPLTGCGLAAQLEREIRDFAPATVITPDVNETHPDHAAIAAFAMYAMAAARFTGRHLSAVVHYRHYPYPWAHLRTLRLVPPPRLVQVGTEWLAVPLDAGDISAKTRAVAEYRSQTSIADMGVYMRAFIRTNELFAHRPPAQLATVADDSCPSPGTAGSVSMAARPSTARAPRARRGNVASLRLLRSPEVLWVGLVGDRPPHPRDAYSVSARLFGPGVPQRLEVSVVAGAVTANGVGAGTTGFDGVQTRCAGSTLWIAVPASALGDCTALMISATVRVSGRRPTRMPWRVVEIAPAADHATPIP